MIRTLIKNILKNVRNYPTYRIPYILREIGNHPTDANQEYIKNGWNYPTYGIPDILSGVGNIKYIEMVGNKKGRKSS